MKKIVYLLSIGLMTTLLGCGSPTTAPVKETITLTTQAPTVNKTALPIEKEQNGIKVKLTKVEQDSDSLKIYVTYTNNTKDQLKPNRAADKVIANGKQLDCDPQFNLDRVAKLKLAHADWLEPGVTADDVILFSPVQGADKINIALYPNDTRINFEDVPLTSN